MLKAEARVIIQRDIFTVTTDEVEGWAKFKRDRDGYEFEGYCGRLVEELQPMHNAPKDGTVIKLLDQGEVHVGYHNSDPAIGWTEGFDGQAWPCLIPDGWAPLHASEVEQRRTA